MTAWASIKFSIFDDWEPAATIARLPSVSLSRAIIGLTSVVDMRLIDYRDRGLHLKRPYRRRRTGRSLFINAHVAFYPEPFRNQGKQLRQLSHYETPASLQGPHRPSRSEERR